MNARIPLEERIKQLRAMLNEPCHSSKERIDDLEWALDQTLSMVGKLAYSVRLDHGRVHRRLRRYLARGGQLPGLSQRRVTRPSIATAKRN